MAVLILLFLGSGVGNATASDVALPVASAARPEVVKGNERRLLDQFQRYLEARQWDDAWRVVSRLLESDSTGTVQIEESLYVSLPAYCQRLLSELPTDALAHYRELVDPAAEAWYHQGVKERDPRALNRVIDEMFCSSWGDDALLAQGELALGRGDYQAARSYWSRIGGRQSGLTYPDSEINSAEIEARLALVSIRAGQWERAAEEIARLAATQPDAKGRLAGRDVVFSQQLPDLLEQARHWPTPVATLNWPTLGGSFTRVNTVPSYDRKDLQPLWSHSIASADDSKPSTFPIVADDLVVYQNETGVRALQLATGEQVFHSDSPTVCSVRSTLTARGHQLFGTEPDGTLWGMDLSRDGALNFRVSPNNSKTVFVGAPVADGTLLLLDARNSNRSARAGVACFDFATSELLWQHWLCHANLPHGGDGANLLTSTPGVVYACTNLGAIAAVRADDGRVLWLRTYPRENFSVDEAVSSDKWNPCVYYRDVLYALPSDSRQLLALDAASGELLWSRSALNSTAQLLGVFEDRLVLASDGLHLLDSNTGDVLDSDFSCKLAGKGVVVGSVIFWPESQSIRRFDISTGDELIGDVPLPAPGGANLLVAGNYILACGQTELTAFSFVSDQADPPH